MSKIMAAVALSVLLATPTVAFAAKAHRAYAQAPNETDASGMNTDRARAMQECTAQEQKYNNVTWGDYEIALYRACMAAHHQSE